MCYNAYIMTDNNVQLTIRGLDEPTKRALSQRAATQGMSLNKYLVYALKRSAGTDGKTSRLRALRAFVQAHPVAHTDLQAMADAISWADTASLTKQKRDDTCL